VSEVRREQEYIGELYERVDGLRDESGGGEPLLIDWRAPATLAEVAVREAAGGGRLAVIVPDDRVRELGEAVLRAAPGVSFGDSPDLTSSVVLLGARQAKGLEFDSVLIADPGGILAASPRGRNDLYVAMTRSTQRLGVLHAGAPPAEIAALPRW
jgi:DNA helicase IV